MRAANEEGSYDRIFSNYKKGYFKFASKNFYSEFLAAQNVANFLEKNSHGGLAPEAKHLYLKLPGYAHIHEIARHFGLPLGIIEELNPALLPPVTSGEKFIPKGYALRLPAGSKTNQLVASLPPSLFRNDQKSSLNHRVQKGDTVNNIARLHKVSVKNLIQANNLDKFATVHLGQDLRIPGKTNVTTDNDSKTKAIPLKLTFKKVSQPRKPCSQKRHKASTDPINPIKRWGCPFPFLSDATSAETRPAPHLLLDKWS